MEKRIVRDTRQLPITLYLPLPHETPEQAAARLEKADPEIIRYDLGTLVFFGKPDFEKAQNP